MPLRTRWLILRSQLSLPALLSDMTERRIVSTVAAIEGGTAILVISLAAWLSGLPLLFPALGPSAFLLFTKPFSPASAPRSVILGHGIGIICGWAMWALTSLLAGQEVSLTEPDLALCASANLAFALTCLLLVRFSCPHAPACASALIVATGAMTAWSDLLVMAGAVTLLAGQGIIIHRLLGVNAPLWRQNRAGDPAALEH